MALTKWQCQCVSLHWLAGTSRQSSLIGLSMMLVRVWSITLLTTPLRSGLMSTTLAVIHDPHGELASAINTVSPCAKFLLVPLHFWCSCMSGRYSLTHLNQNRSNMYCIWRQKRLTYMSSGSKISICTLHKSRWFRVNSSKSFGSFDMVVKGRLLRIASTSHMTSSNVCCFATERKILFSVLINLSHTPPWWTAAGGLKVYSTPYCCMSWLILSWLQVLSVSFRRYKVGDIVRS